MPLRRTDEGALLLALRVTPNARKAGVEGLETLADGRRVLKVKVAAPPEDGKANAAVVALLAKAWRLPKRDLEIVSGQTQRLKTLRISAEGPDEGAERQAKVAAMLDAAQR